MEKDIRYVRSAIEDLAFTSCSSRVTIWGNSHIVGEAVLSTTLPRDQRCGQAREQRLERRTCLMDMEHTENYAHTKWKSPNNTSYLFKHRHRGKGNSDTDRGISKAKMIPGEEKFLGMGVSYCATDEGCTATIQAISLNTGLRLSRS